jgi:hypothetical protein
VPSDSGERWTRLYSVKNPSQNTRASWTVAKDPGKSDRYFIVLNCASLNGSLLTRGREWDRVTPRSTSSAETGLEVIDVPREHLAPHILTVGVHGVRHGAVAGDCLVQEVLGQRRVLPGGGDPAGVVAGVDVDQDVQWNQTPLVGPRSLFMSELHTCEGPSARSSGLTFAGWVAWARRSRVCPAAAAIRYMLDREHQHRPSSSSRTHTCPIERSALPTVLSTPRTAGPFGGAQRLGRRPALGLRYRRAPHLWWAQPAVVAGPGTTGQCAHRPGRHPGLPQTVERHGHDLLGWVAAMEQGRDHLHIRMLFP